MIVRGSEFEKRRKIKTVAVFAAGLLMLPVMFAHPASAQSSPVQWQNHQSPDSPGPGAIVGGPGDAPEHGSPLYVCRAAYEGGSQPGKWVKGNCNVTYNSKEVVMHAYQVLYGQAEWRPYTGVAPDLLQTGNEANGSPLYTCRVQYKDHGYQPGKLTGGKCDIPYDGKEVVKSGSFEALYVGHSGGNYAASQVVAPPAKEHKSGGGLMGKLVANAEYQQAKQNGASASDLEAIKQSAGVDNGVPDNTNSDRAPRTTSRGGYLPPCRSEDHDAHLENGFWVGPNCFKEPDDGHYVSNEEAQKQQADLRAQRNSQRDQARRADFVESNSCMTTDGADKANALAADCEKVTDAPHKACNIQENSCDEIRNATRKGCNGLAAEGPDWCLTRYN